MELTKQTISQPVTSLVMTPQYDLLLRGSAETPAGVYQLHLVTAEQLTRLHYRRGSLKLVKARLKALTDAGYLQHDTVPSRAMRTPYYYVLDKLGAKYLAEAGCDVSASWRPSKEVGQGALFVEHTLEVNDVLISALLLHKVSPYRLERFEHERLLKRRPYKADHFAVIPDAFLSFSDGVDRFPLLLEHDRGTEEQVYFRRRIRGYASLLKSGDYVDWFGTEALRVVFTTFVGAQRIEQMRAWTKAELANEPGSEAAFCFAHLTPPLDPASVWLGANWLRYDEQPPEVLLAA